jgi:hypothetical protein
VIVRVPLSEVGRARVPLQTPLKTTVAWRSVVTAKRTWLRFMRFALTRSGSFGVWLKVLSPIGASPSTPA